MTFGSDAALRLSSARGNFADATDVDGSRMRTSFAIAALLAASAAGALVPGGCTTSRREAVALLGACAAQLSVHPASAEEGERRGRA